MIMSVLEFVILKIHCYNNRKLGNIRDCNGVGYIIGMVVAIAHYVPLLGSNVIATHARNV